MAVSSMRRRRTTALLPTPPRLWAVVLVILPSAQAAEERWTAQITPYLWATGVGGTLRPFDGAPTVRIDKSFSELNKDLDGAAFLSGFARRDRLVLVGDASGSSSSRRAVAPPGVPASGRLRQTSLTLAGGYRVMDEPARTLDLLVGARAWFVRAAVLAPPLNLRLERRVDFVDPILAARLNLRLSPHWSLLTYADFGGFGAGSRFTAQGVATANYQVRDNLHLSAGYRYLHVDYRGDGSRIDVRAGGPLFGVTFQF